MGSSEYSRVEGGEASGKKLCPICHGPLDVDGSCKKHGPMKVYVYIPGEAIPA